MSKKQLLTLTGLHLPVRQVLHKWQKLGLEGLWDKPGRGGKTKYSSEDIVFLEECLKKEPRTDNSLQLAQKKDTRAPNKVKSRQVKTGTKKNQGGKIDWTDNSNVVNPLSLENQIYVFQPFQII